jgi:hypothetical protein
MVNNNDNRSERVSEFVTSGKGRCTTPSRTHALTHSLNHSITLTSLNPPATPGLTSCLTFFVDLPFFHSLLLTHSFTHSSPFLDISPTLTSHFTLHSLTPSLTHEVHRAPRSQSARLSGAATRPALLRSAHSLTHSLTHSSYRYTTHPPTLLFAMSITTVLTHSLSIIIASVTYILTHSLTHSCR